MRQRRSPWTPPLAAAALSALLAVVAPAHAQPSPATTTRLTRILAGDSVTLASPFAASRSPDGRWLVFARTEGETGASLWIAPTTGGAPTRLTPGTVWNSNPRWAPSGDRIFFISNQPVRTGEDKQYVMTLRVDPRTGRAVDAPRQVTLDPVAVNSNGVRPSPDGRWIAYAHADEPGVLKVVPATGGAARMVARLAGRIGVTSWSADGREIFAAVRPVPGGPQWKVVRVPVEGGKPVAVASAHHRITGLAPQQRYFITTVDGPGARDRHLELVSFDGAILGRVRVNRDAFPTEISPDGRTLTLAERSAVAPIMLVPVAGGKIRQLTPPDYYDWPHGWLPDGSAAVIVGEHQGQSVIKVVPVDGGPQRSFTLPTGGENPDWRWAVAGRHALSSTRVPGTDLFRLVAVDLHTGRGKTISESALHAEPFGTAGRYGSTGREFVFAERRGDRVEIRAAAPEGSSRLVRSFPADRYPGTIQAVAGQRVLWTQTKGDSALLWVADGPSAPPRRVFASRRTPAAGFSGSSFGELSVSDDGRLVVTHHPDAEGDPILVLEVPEAGEGPRPPRVINHGYTYWYQPRWLPDRSGVVIIAGGQGGASPHLVRIPLSEREQPVVLTRDDPAGKWGYEMSPDGKWLIYPSEISRGSSVWTMDLGWLGNGAGGRR